MSCASLEVCGNGKMDDKLKFAYLQMELLKATPCHWFTAKASFVYINLCIYLYDNESNIFKIYFIEETKKCSGSSRDKLGQSHFSRRIHQKGIKEKP